MLAEEEEAEALRLKCRQQIFECVGGIEGAIERLCSLKDDVDGWLTVDEGIGPTSIDYANAIEIAAEVKQIATDLHEAHRTYRQYRDLVPLII